MSETADMNRRLIGLSSMATRHILADLARDFEARTRASVEFRSMGGSGGQTGAGGRKGGHRRARLEGHARPRGRRPRRAGQRPGLRPIGSRARGRRRRAAAPRPERERGEAGDERGAEALLLNGPSGDHFKALCEKWGLANSLLARALKAPPGVPVTTLVAQGDADLGIQQLSELIGQPGIEVVGPLPPEMQAVTIFSAGVSTNPPRGGGERFRGLSGFGGGAGRHTAPRHGAGMNAPPGAVAARAGHCGRT